MGMRASMSLGFLMPLLGLKFSRWIEALDFRFQNLPSAVYGVNYVGDMSHWRMLKATANTPMYR